MKKRVREDISAYLDGEAKDASSIARLIAESGDASQEHLAFAELSARLRSLNEPDIHPAFAARVVATIEEQRDRRAARWRIPAIVGVAAAMLLVAALSYDSLQTVAPVTPVLNVANTPASLPAQAVDENTLMAELERRVSEDADVQHFVLARFENTPQPADLYTDRLIAAVAGSRGAAVAGGAFAHGIDYRAAVQRLDDVQADALKQMLSASVREAQEG
jgi:hypothetical protein